MTHASKIAQELLDATDLSTVRNEAAQAMMARLVKAVYELSEPEWDKLGQPAQDWFNAAVDAKNNDLPELPEFPDLAKPDAAAPRRRGTAAAAEERLTKVGDTATIKTKRGREVTGVVLELSDKIIVLKTADGEEEFPPDRLESITVAHGDAGAGADDPAEPEVEVGGMVSLKTKRGREVEGKVVELTEDMIVLDVDGKEEEFNRDRVETIHIKAGAPPAAARSTRGTPAAAPAAADEKKRASNPGGVSVSQRIREHMADNPAITQEAVGKLLKAEKLEFAEASLKMNFGDNKKFLDLLAAAGKLKK